MNATRLGSSILLSTTLLLAVSTSHAADVLMPGKVTILKPGKLAKFVAKPEPGGTFAIPAPGSDGDPTTAGTGGGGGQLELFDVGVLGGTNTYALPAGVAPLGWRGLGNPPGSKGYKYKGAGTPGDPCKVVLVKSKVVKAVCRGTDVTLTTPLANDLGIVLALGATLAERYCAQLGGTNVQNRTDLFKEKKAPAPAACPEFSCGNGLLDPYEQCDGPASSCGGAGVCDSLCQCPCTIADCPCDFLDPSGCLYPFPSDFLTVVDGTTDTGLRVNFTQEVMPRNTSGTSMDVTEYNRSDGASPGSSIIFRVPDVDLDVTGAAPITDIARSLDTDAPIVIVNATTLAHHIHFAEIDSNASTELQRAVFVRPAINFDEGERYIVAVRNMRNADGDLLTPGGEFLAYRDNVPTGDAAKEARRAHMEDLFTTLAAAGVPRADLYLAWDFTVASQRNNTERLLFMRDDAFTRLGGSAPAFVITNVQEFTPAEDPKIFRRVSGTMTVDRYVDSTTAPARLVLDASNLPVYQGTDQPATFICNIPRAALADGLSLAVPGRASIYGHGLLGAATEVNNGHVTDMANEHNFVFCATRWMGMAVDDIVTAIGILNEMGLFPRFPDRQQQGMLNQLFLARLMIHANGLISDAAFQDFLGNPVIDTSDVFFDGNSQGGIFGGTVMAISQDITRGVLGVPGMNYSTLLQRSSDFPTYAAILYPNYPNELERPLLFGLIQMLWDRSEPNGYARHITNDLLPGTPQHFVMLHEAFGDHQVSNVTTQIEARTIGASVVSPPLPPGRSFEVDPYYDIPAIPSYPFAGSALIPWDSGADQPPTTNTAPMTGFDPHSDPRNFVDARQQKSDFLTTGGSVTDACSGGPCVIP